VNALRAVHLVPAPPPPPSPVSVSLIGSDFVQPFATCTWQASATGGTPPYTYAWEADGQVVGSGSILMYTNAGSDFWLNLVVTDSNGSAASNGMPVTVSWGANECLEQ
jgi:hypothetical protein